MKSTQPKMKGQNLILAEILLFAFGLAIANFVIVVFQKTESRTGEFSTKDNYRLVAGMISTAIIKASQNTNATVKVLLPEKISGRIYEIHLQGGAVTVIDEKNPDINVTQKLFNITQENCISDNAFCAGGIVTSTAGSAEIVANGKTILLRRAR